MSFLNNFCRILKYINVANNPNIIPKHASIFTIKPIDEEIRILIISFSTISIKCAIVTKHNAEWFIINIKADIILFCIKQTSVKNSQHVNLDFIAVIFINKISSIFSMDNFLDLIFVLSKLKNASKKTHINEKHVYIITTIRINVDLATYNIVTFFVLNKNAIISTVSFLTINYNNCTIQIVTKQNSVNSILEIYKNAIIKVFVLLLIHKIK